MHSFRGEVFESEQALQQLDGLDLQWWELTIGMGSLLLKIHGPTSETAYLHFAPPDYIDTPLMMHDVRLRPATRGSWGTLLRRLHPQSAALADLLADMSWKDLLHITCTEGEFFLWTAYVQIYIGAIPSVEALQRSKELIRASGLDPNAPDFWTAENREA